MNIQKSFFCWPNSSLELYPVTLESISTWYLRCIMTHFHPHCLAFHFSFVTQTLVT